MKENAITYINSSITKKFDDEFFIGMITNYRGDLWHVEYEDGDEDFDDIEVRKGIKLYSSLK